MVTLASRLPAYGTFRDPAGRLYRDGARVLREIYPQHSTEVIEWLVSSLAQRWMEQRRMVPTSIVSSDFSQPVLLEHEPIFFPTYPWEWTPSQWIEGGTLTLDLCEEAVSEGYILKDATPLNVLFSGSRAIFVDVLSLERRDPRNPLWIAYSQFVRTFLLPLVAFKYFGWPLTATQQRRDGYEPADFAPVLPIFRRWSRPLLSLVTLPLLLEGSSSAGTRHREASEEMSSFAVRRLLRSARSLLESLRPIKRTSRWSSYPVAACHYESADHAAKQAFVRESLESTKPRRVLDVGANTGVYSRIAAECGADVVAWDTDMESTELNWQAARHGGLQILPLVADFARPTPAVGWQNRENSSLLDRARGKFDCVLMLGILHHLIVADQIPLAAITSQLAEITIRWAILEWIPKDDAQFDGLCRGRRDLYRHLTEKYFVQTISQQFLVRRRHQLANGRILMLLERKQ